VGRNWEGERERGMLKVDGQRWTSERTRRVKNKDETRLEKCVTEEGRSITQREG